MCASLLRWLLDKIWFGIGWMGVPAGLPGPAGTFFEAQNARVGMTPGRHERLPHVTLPGSRRPALPRAFWLDPCPAFAGSADLLPRGFRNAMNLPPARSWIRSLATRPAASPLQKDAVVPPTHIRRLRAQTRPTRWSRSLPERSP